MAPPTSDVAHRRPRAGTVAERPPFACSITTTNPLPISQQAVARQSHSAPRRRGGRAHGPWSRRRHQSRGDGARSGSAPDARARGWSPSSRQTKRRQFPRSSLTGCQGRRGRARPEAASDCRHWRRESGGRITTEGSPDLLPFGGAAGNRPSATVLLTCGNIGFDDAKRREST